MSENFFFFSLSKSLFFIMTESHTVAKNMYFLDKLTNAVKTKKMHEILFYCSVLVRIIRQVIIIIMF